MDNPDYLRETCWDLPLITLAARVHAHEKRTHDIIAEFSDLLQEDVSQSLEYAAWLACDEIQVG
jgi:hypothetical protein